jgi:hypothetical protein
MAGTFRIIIDIQRQITLMLNFHGTANFIPHALWRLILQPQLNTTHTQGGKQRNLLSGTNQGVESQPIG